MRIRDLQKMAYENSKAHGFHDGPVNVPEKLCLIHSEVSEALEEHRKGRLTTEFAGKGRFPTDGEYQGKPEGLPSELADIVIRVADLAEALGIDLEREIELKHGYNVSRPRKHGKAY